MEENIRYIIENGSNIVLNIAKQYPNGVITNLNDVNSFFAQLMQETKGLLIVDFLDTDNWDNIKDYKIDIQKGLLYVYWKIPRSFEDELLEEMEKMIFPFESYGFILKFKQLKFFTIGENVFFTIQGYAVKKKDVKRIAEEDNYNCIWTNENDVFSVELVREKDKKREHWYFLNTPIYSVLFFPKHIPLKPQQSKIILFLYNLDDCSERLKTTKEELLKIPKTADLKLHDFEDAVCSKANTMRRIMEFILKLEICLYSQDVPKKIEDYSNLLLGDLIKLIKDKKTQDEMVILNKIVRLSNTLSHDSGLPIKIEDANDLWYLINDYSEQFSKQLKKSL